MTLRPPTLKSLAVGFTWSLQDVNGNVKLSSPIYGHQRLRVSSYMLLAAALTEICCTRMRGKVRET